MPLNVEILTIGDEILTGHTVDTNASWLAAELTAMGLAVLYQTSVGDDLQTMEAAIRLALKRADIVIATGGLAGIIAPFSTLIRQIEPDLTLRGLRIAASHLGLRW